MRIGMNFFLSSPKITNFMYEVHIRIHIRICIWIRENKRKNSNTKFQKFVHEFLMKEEICVQIWTNQLNFIKIEI